MISGGDKYSGGVVGRWRSSGGSGAEIAAESAFGDASVEETLVGGDGAVSVRAVLSPDGRIAWRVEPDTAATFRRTVVMSQMASMLKDRFRNAAYDAAISRCLEAARSLLRRDPIVLDIGAGTGLLSMLAARSGARTVHAVEQWDVMAAIAKSVVGGNPDVADKIKLHALHSSELSVRASVAKSAHAPVRSSPLAGGNVGVTPHEIPQASDVLVSEILDSALLGEGVIPAISHAYAKLMRPAPPDEMDSTALCVPASAEVFAQLVHSPAFSAWHSTANTHIAGFSEVPLHRTDWEAVCLADAVPIPVHVKSIMPAVTAISPVFKAATIRFSRLGVAEIDASEETASVLSNGGARFSPRRQVLRVPSLHAAASDVAANALVFWWKACLWQGGERSRESSELSDPAGTTDCTSNGAGASSAGSKVEYCTCVGCSEVQGWQDHWVQCVVPLPVPISSSLSESGASAAPASAGVPAAVGAEHYFSQSQCCTACSTSTSNMHTYPVAHCPRSLVALATGACAHSDCVRPADASDAADAVVRRTIAAGQPCFTVVVDIAPMALSFRVGGGAAEVWSSKRLRSRAVKAGSALPLSAVAGGPGSVLYVDEPEPCTCGLHSACTLERRWALNDPDFLSCWSAGAAAAALQAASLVSAGTSSAAGAALPSRAGEVQLLTIASLGDGSLGAMLAGTALRDRRPLLGAGSLRLLALEDSRVMEVHTIALAEAQGLLRQRAGDYDDDASGPALAIALLPQNSGPGDSAAAGTTNLVLQTVLDAFHLVCGVCDDEGCEGGALEDAAVPVPKSAAVGTALTVQSRGSLQIDALIIEPTFARMQAQPVWCALSAWLRRTALQPALAPACVVYPARARVCAQLVTFAHLSDNHGCVGAVRGFDHSPFDAVEAGWHAHTYTYPLHQYAHTARSEPATAWAALDLRAPCPLVAGDGAGVPADSLSFEAQLPVLPRDAAVGCAELLAAIFWVEYDESDGTEYHTVLSTSAAVAPHHRQHVRWIANGAAWPSSVSVGLRIERSREDGGISWQLSAN